ncbi:MFS transporter [Halobellus captivus]|uniref:MFS transporter n=1 Tax=Halobellus captivus TaxID=2592614 RepID=UPI001396C9E2|nr:MFS transporter [Halobellus captivus]
MTVKIEYRYVVLITAVLAQFSQIGSRLIISPLVPDIISTFEISKGSIGLVLTVMWATYAVMQFPSGLLGDRFGQRSVIIAAIGLSALGSFLLAMSPSFAIFGIFAVSLGAGTGLFYPVAASYLSKHFDNTGVALGALTAGGAAAGLIIPAVAAWVSSIYGWRIALALAGIIAVLVLFVIVVSLQSTTPIRPNQNFRKEINLSVITEFLSRSSIAFTTIIAILFGFVFQAFISFFPTFLIEFHSMTANSAAISFGVIFLLSTASQPVMGNLSDSYSRDLLLVVSAILSSIGFSILLTSNHQITLIVAIVLLGIGISWPGIVQARYFDIIPKSKQGTEFGLARSIYIFLGALGSVVTGWTADIFGWGIAYGLVVLLLILAICAIASNKIFKLQL